MADHVSARVGIRRYSQINFLDDAAMLKSVHAEIEGAVHAKVYERLRYALMIGYFKPGQQLSIRYLSTEMGISATPAREALKRLQAEQALFIGTNRTPTVPELSKLALREITDIRTSLEGMAAERAVNKITGVELERLRVYCREMDRAVDAGDIGQYLVGNWAFHRTIYELGANTLLMNIIEGLWMRIGPYFWLVGPTAQNLDQFVSSHRAAIEALSRRDGPGAWAAIVADITGCASELMPLLPDNT